MFVRFRSAELAEKAWPSGLRVGLIIRRSRVRSTEFKSSATLVNSQLVCLQPFEILNNVLFSLNYLFQLFARPPYNLCYNTGEGKKKVEFWRNVLPIKMKMRFIECFEPENEWVHHSSGNCHKHSIKVTFRADFRTNIWDGRVGRDMCKAETKKKPNTQVRRQLYKVTNF